MSDSITLARTPLMRAVGGTLFQPLFLLLWILLLVTSPVGQGRLAKLVAGLVLLLVWLVGATAWIRVDQTGISRRCYLKSDYPWTSIQSIDLRTQHFGLQGAREVIRVRVNGRHHLLNPAGGRNRSLHEFARQFLAAAQARGIATDTSGWIEADR